MDLAPDLFIPSLSCRCGQTLDPVLLFGVTRSDALNVLSVSLANYGCTEAGSDASFIAVVPLFDLR